MTSALFLAGQTFANAAAGAVKGGDGYCESIVLAALTSHLDGLSPRERSPALLCSEQGTDDSVRADIGALGALDAVFGYHSGMSTAMPRFSKPQCPGKYAAGCVHKGGNRQAVAAHIVDGDEHFLDIFGKLGPVALDRDLCTVSSAVFQSSGYELLYFGKAGVHGWFIFTTASPFFP